MAGDGTVVVNIEGWEIECCFGPLRIGETVSWALRTLESTGEVGVARHFMDEPIVETVGVIESIDVVSVTYDREGRTYMPAVGVANTVRPIEPGHSWLAEPQSWDDILPAVEPGSDQLDFSWVPMRRNALDLPRRKTEDSLARVTLRLVE